jgi:hypothetical protein
LYRLEQALARANVNISRGALQPEALATACTEIRAYVHPTIAKSDSATLSPPHARKSQYLLRWRQT